MMDGTAGGFRGTGRPRHADILTPAEWDVLDGVRSGLSNAGIAARRGSSLETVRFHLRNLRAKLGLHSREALRQWPGRPRASLADAAARFEGRRIREQIPLVAVRDLPRCLGFYIDRLGLSVVSRWPDPPLPPRWAALAGGAARVMLHEGHHLAERADASGGAITLSFYVEGLDAYHADLRAAGCGPGAITQMWYGAREFYVRDPEGNEIAIVEFAASEPEYLAASTADTKESAS